jgi:hypothetical protein
MHGVSLHPPYLLMSWYIVTLIDSFTVSLADAPFHIHWTTAVEFLTIMLLLQKVMVSKPNPQIGHYD